MISNSQGVVSGAFLLVRKEMNLTDTWHELIVSATIAAALVTALISGRNITRGGNPNPHPKSESDPIFGQKT